MAKALSKVEIIKGVPIALSVIGPEGVAAEKRFIEVFGTVWQRLPGPARFALLKKWGKVSGIAYLTPIWKQQWGKLAQCALTGSMFHFLSPAVARMSNAILGECISHELAHAFFYATGDPYHCGGSDNRFYSKDLQRRLAEALARDLVSSWGFNPRSLSQWCVDNADWLERYASASPSRPPSA